MRLRLFAIGVLLLGFFIGACTSIDDQGGGGGNGAKEPVYCPADVYQCPDGSYVSRDPDNNCAFKPCPGA